MAPLSRCPYCRARGLALRDTWALDAVLFEWLYCGGCGRTLPQADGSTAPRIVRRFTLVDGGGEDEPADADRP